MPPMNNVKNSSSTSPITTSSNQWHTLAKSKDLNKTYSNRNFPLKVLHNLNILRKNAKFCDVSIAAGGNLLKVSYNSGY